MPRIPFIPFASPKLLPAPPTGTEWLHEVKFDGFRIHSNVDVAKALPVAYAVSSVLIVMSALLIYADFVKPVKLG